MIDTIDNYRETILVLTCLVLLQWPTLAHASDMTILMFFYSLPVCIGLVVFTFVLAFLITPRAIGLLLFPIAALVAIHLYMLPHMYHSDEIVAFALQAAVSSLSLASFRIVKRRATVASEDSSPVDER
jgi:hypothetical protein